MKKKLYFIAILMACVCTFCACSDDDGGNGTNPPVSSVSSGAFVVNQGNFYSKIAGSIGYLNYENGSITDSVFFRQNGILAGNTVQAGIINGDNLFVIAYESNVMLVMNKSNFKLLKMIEVSSPRALATSGRYVYVSNYNGFVTRVDGTSLQVKDSVKVGPNPEEMAIANGYLYVVNSDGMNYDNGYANGKSVSKINLMTFQVEKTISVGLNPTKAAADSKGNVFVVATGDYSAVNPSKIQKINNADEVSDFVEGTQMCICGDTLYAVNSVTDWNTYQTVNTFFKMSTEDGSVAQNYIQDNGVEYPIVVRVDPNTKHVFITSHNAGSYGANYDASGYMNEYTSNGQFVHKYATGVNPVDVVFNVK